MKNYYRQKNSIYANYRYSNPYSANFIAPEGKVANFMDLNPQMFGDAWNAARNSDVAQQAVDMWNNFRGRGGGTLIPDELYQPQMTRPPAMEYGTGFNVPDLTTPGYSAEIPVGMSPPIQAPPLPPPGYNTNPNLLERGQGFLREVGRYIQGNPVQAAEAAAGGAAAGAIVGKGAKRLAKGRAAANAGAAADEVVDQVMRNPGIMERFNNLGMPAKLGIGGAGLAAAGGAGYLGYNALQNPEAQYSYGRRTASFRRRYR